MGFSHLFAKHFLRIAGGHPSSTLRLSSPANQCPYGQSRSKMDPSCTPRFVISPKRSAAERSAVLNQPELRIKACYPGREWTGTLLDEQGETAYSPFLDRRAIDETG